MEDREARKLANELESFILKLSDAYDNQHDSAVSFDRGSLCHEFGWDRAEQLDAALTAAENSLEILRKLASGS